MSTASFLPAAARARRWPTVRRLAAWLVATASDPKAGLWLVIGFAAAHAVLWTLILVNLKAAQDVHMDVAEAFAWGQKFQFGYGKHPPLVGMGRRPLVHGFSGRQLGDLCAGDGDARLRPRDLLADRACAWWIAAAPSSSW